MFSRANIDAVIDLELASPIERRREFVLFSRRLIETDIHGDIPAMFTADHRYLLDAD